MDGLSNYQKEPNASLYHYKATLMSIYDGDTIRVSFELGLGVEYSGPKGKGESLRLYGINAPELRGEEREMGIVSRDALIDLFDSHREYGGDFIVQTIKAPSGGDKKGKYGRYLAILWLEFEDGWINANDYLVKHGYAEVRVY